MGSISEIVIDSLVKKQKLPIKVMKGVNTWQRKVPLQNFTFLPFEAAGGESINTSYKKKFE